MLKSISDLIEFCEKLLHIQKLFHKKSFTFMDYYHFNKKFNQLMSLNKTIPII